MSPNRKQQTGSALVLVMVTVLVLLLGGVAAIRATETAAVLAGNSAFREATKQAADVGINSAFSFVSALTTPDTAVANSYFPLRQTEDTYGMPSTIDWTQVLTTVVQNYSVQYVVERLCTGILPVTDSVNNCVTDTVPATGSKKLGSQAYASPATTVYRVTVRTRGPKNAEAYTQALISR